MVPFCVDFNHTQQTNSCVKVFEDPSLKQIKGEHDAS